MNVSLFLEIKNEYTEHLVETLTPYIFEGLKSIYDSASRLANEQNYPDRTLIIFQKYLISVADWNQTRIEEETNRIKHNSNTIDYLDDLIKAVIKSNIILLAYTNSISNLIGQTFYNTLTTSSLIHRCYMECAKDAHNYPFLFYDGDDLGPIDVKRNQALINTNIRNGITRAIRKILPLSLILKEYLINSVNIIQEAPKIELVGRPEPIFGEIPEPFENPKLTSEKKFQNENKIDPVIEKGVLSILKSENNKTEKQKIQAILNLDKIINNMEQSKKISQPASVKSPYHEQPKYYSEKYHSDNMMSAQKQSSVKHIPDMRLLNDGPILVGDDPKQPIIARGNDLDEKLININLNEKSAGENSSKKIISGTTLSAKRNIHNVSESIDLKTAKLIEEYGNDKQINNKNSPYNINKSYRR